MHSPATEPVVVPSSHHSDSDTAGPSSSYVVGKHNLKNPRVGNNSEPPVHLMCATTILIGNCDFIQIGYIPKLNNGDVDFLLACVIVINQTWMVLDRIEWNSFVMFLSHMTSERSDESQPSEEEELMGKFFFDLIDEYIIITYCNYEKMTDYTLHLPSMAVVEHLCSLGAIVGGHMFSKYALHEENANNMGHKLEKAAKECKNIPTHIKFLSEHTSDTFVTELGTNFYSFFIQYFEMFRKNELGH